MYCQNCQRNTSTKANFRGRADQKEICDDCHKPKKMMPWYGHTPSAHHLLGHPPPPPHMMGHPNPIDIPPHIAYLLTEEEYFKLMEKLISRSR